MKKRSIILTIIVAIIYLSFAVSIGAIAVSYYNRKFTKVAESNYLEANVLESEQLSKRLNTDYELFKDKINTFTNAQLNSDKPNVYNQLFLGFGEVLDDGLIFEGNIKKNYLLNLNKQYFIQNISIYNFNQVFQDESSQEPYIFFIHEGRFGYFHAKTYLDSVLITKEYFIANNDGLILYNGKPNSPVTNLNGYYNDSSVIVGKLKSSASGTSIDKTSDGKLMSTYSQIEAINDLYFIKHLDHSVFLIEISDLGNPIIAIVIIYSIVLIILSVIAARMFTSVYRDVELSFHHMSYNVIPIIRINRKGRILYRNKQFKKDFFDFSNNKYITEIFMVDMLDVLKQIQIRAWLLVPTGPYNSARLNIIKTSIRGYTVLIYPIIGTETLEESTVINIHTGIESLNQYKLDFQELKKDAKPSVSSQAVVNIKIINLRNVELMRGAAYVEEAIFKAAHRLRVLSSRLPNIGFYHALDNSFILFYKGHNQLEIREDVRRIIKTFEEEKLDQEFDISLYLKAGVYEFNIRSEKSGAIFVYEKAKIACDQLSQSVDSVLGIYASATDRALQQNFLIAHDLEEAVNNKELYMALQPIYDQEEDKISGFEALLRWNNPKYSSVSPTVLISVANQSNFLLKLGNYIINESLIIAKELEKYDLTIAINLDPLQLLQVGFVDIIKNLLAEKEVDPNKIIFELTENNLITFFDVINPKIKELRNLGIKIHIDDFGTGNSSLLYLKELSFDGIKIDRRFINGIENDKYLRAIVQMVIGLAKNVEAEIVAEGVETLQQLEYLEKRGVKYIQGYYIGRPMPLNQAIEGLKTNKKRSK